MSINVITPECIDNRVMYFINNIRPPLVMGELQAIAALAIFLKSGDSSDIPGERNRK